MLLFLTFLFCSSVLTFFRIFWHPTDKTFFFFRWKRYHCRQLRTLIYVIAEHIITEQIEIHYYGAEDVFPLCTSYCGKLKLPHSDTHTMLWSLRIYSNTWWLMSWAWSACDLTLRSLLEVGRTPAESLLLQDKRSTFVCNCVWHSGSPSGQSCFPLSGLKLHEWWSFRVQHASESRRDTNIKFSLQNITWTAGLKCKYITWHQ